MTKTNNAIYGRYLGYPDCCIEAFGDVARLFRYRPQLTQEMTVNGFLPCEKCALKLKNKETTYEDLINPNRKCSIPFKEQHTIEENRIIGDELWAL